MISTKSARRVDELSYPTDHHSAANGRSLATSSARTHAPALDIVLRLALHGGLGDILVRSRPARWSDRAASGWMGRTVWNHVDCRPFGIHASGGYRYRRCR